MRPIKYHPNNPPTIAIIGEAPGANEMRVGQPFIGPEGQYMNKLLNIAGLNRFDCFISNTVQEQPPRNDYSLLRQDQLDFGRKELIEDLTNYRDKGLTTVIAVGAKAMELLTGKTGIYRYRGTALPCTLVEGLKVYSTIYPGNILRGEGKYEPIFILDVKKAIADSKTAEITYPYRNIQIISTEQEAIFQLSLITNIDTPVVIDIETAGPKMTAFGWAISPHQAYVLDSKILENPTVLNYLGRFASSKTPKIFHNALFDVFHGAYYYQILYKNIDFDTMIAQHSAYPTLPKSLGFCASIYTNEPYWKEEGKEAMEELKRGILSWDKLYIYNGKDCCLTYEIYTALKQELTDWDVWEVFNERMAMLPACLYAQMRGLLLDKEACEALAQKNEKAIDTLEYIKEQVIGDINIRSSKQLSELIYGQWGMPVHKKGGRVTTEEKKLRMMLRYPTPYSAALGLILELKERYKLRDFYNVKTDEDGRVRCSMKITGTYTGRLATSASITGSGCVPDDHEVLSRMGWKSIKDVIVGEEIACWKNGRITFEKVLETYKYGYTGDLITSTHSLHPHRYTRTHRIPWTRPNRPFNVETAEVYADRKVVQIPASGYYQQGKKHNPTFLRLIAMIQADFSIEGFNYIRGSFKKERKKERARELLTQASIELGLDWKETTYENGYTRFTLKNCSDIVNFFEDDKTIPWSILSYNQESLSQFLDEVGEWDSHKRGNSFIYATTNERNKDVITTIAHLVGKTASCRINADNNRGYGQGYNKPLYEINIKNKFYVYQENFKLIRKEPYVGLVYCVTVPTTFFLCRYKNQIIVTGNSNMQNQPKSVRVIYKADPGKILCQCDLSQSEARIVAALCGDIDWLKAFDERDLHKEVAAFLYGIPLEKVQKETHRLIAKRVAHGTHYGMGYMLLSEIIECPPKEAKRLREKYIELRNGIKTWHTRVKQQIREKRFIRTPFGVVIQFFGPIGNLYDTDDDAAVGKIMREAVAAEPQSTSVSYINRGIIKCFEVIPEFDFLLQVHDSILFQVDDNLETLQRVLPQIKELIEVPLTVNNITFSIPLNFEIGYNWGNMTEMKSLNELETAYKELKK